MPSPLEKARQDPDSMKAKILGSARRLFAEYSYSGTTTRMIARDVGIDISTLYYHWGEKNDLYEAVITDINEEIREKLMEIGEIIQSKALPDRLETAIDMVGDYLFAHPEVSNLILHRYFGKNRQEMAVDIEIPKYIKDIAISLDLSLDKKTVSVQAKSKVIAVWNSMLNFISGENFLRPILDINHKDYVRIVKETMKFVFIPAFTQKK